MASRVLGIDFGSKRIGIAVSDPMNIIARGITVVPNSPRAVDDILKIASEYEVAKIVVGMPFTLKGTKGMKAEEVERFIEKLSENTDLEIIQWDERFTTHTAHQTLLTMGVRKKARQSKERIDEMASALILQGYLDSLCS